MIKIRSNIAVVSARLVEKIEALSNPETLLRPVAIDVLSMMTERIHEDGKASDGSQIGTYSPAYMKVRTGNYGNSARFSRGVNAGKAKGSGVYSRGDKKGQARPRYNRSGDTKIIVSLTRKLENAWVVNATSKGYSIGFNNPDDAQKMRWVEEMKKKKIASLTAGEKTYAIDKFRKLVKERLEEK